MQYLSALPKETLIGDCLPLFDFFPNQVIQIYGITDCKLEAVISPNVMPLEQSDKDIYGNNEIKIISLCVKRINIENDLYRIVDLIFESVRAHVIILVKFNGMYKFCGSFTRIIDNKINIMHRTFSQWIYDGFETKSSISFFSTIKTIILEKKNIIDIYNSLYNEISSFSLARDYSFLTRTQITRILDYILLQKNGNTRIKTEIIENCFCYTYCLTPQANSEKSVSKDIKRFYPSECVWYVLNSNKITKTALEKKQILTIEELIQPRLKIKTNDYDDFNVNVNLPQIKIWDDEIIDKDDVDWESESDWDVDL